ncbi:MAG: pitrilysin family protein [Legionella sp.]|uniref:M16 family metallopeptidase n=1 Tax=Legionella sp. TaxID=459 RepID=UPI002849921D|nr:pitrilysin family protein [Legionella sp.]
MCLMALTIGLCGQAKATSFKTEKWQTANGVRVVFYPAKEVPMLDVSLAFAAGSSYDQEHYGLSSLTGHLLNQGSAGQDATAIAEALADTGAQFSVENSRDMVILNLRSLVSKDALAQSSKTFAQIINQPDFPDEAFAREKKQLLMTIEQSHESPEDVADRTFFKALYQQHPYAHAVNGTKKSINAITKKQVTDFYHRYFVAQNGVLVMVGDISSERAHQLAEQFTGNLPKGIPAQPVVQAAQLPQAEHVNTPFPSSQTMIRLGQIGIDHKNPRYFPLMVGNYILGGGSLVSRLAVEVREKRGLTYGIESQFSPMPGEGPFLISLSTRNQQAKLALDIIQKELHTYVSNGPNEQELNAAKQYLTGSFPLSLASNRSIATLLLRMTFYHLPDNYLDTYVARIKAVTKDEIKQAFQQQLNPDKLLLVTVGQS